MAGMVRAALRLSIRPDSEQEFLHVWAQIAEEVRTSPGNLRQTLHRSVDDPRQFLIVSDWIDEGAFRAFERSPEQDALTEPVRRLRKEADMCVYEVVKRVEGTDRGCTPE